MSNQSQPENTENDSVMEVLSLVGETALLVGKTLFDVAGEVLQWAFLGED
jgi:hypothetical protein